MDSEKYDLIVIGGGTAGLRVSLYAASHEHKTALIEPGALGGTCLNTGCIPTKTMLQSSHLYRSLKKLGKFGISAKNIDFDFSKIMTRTLAIVKEGQDHIALTTKNRNLFII